MNKVIKLVQQKQAPNNLTNKYNVSVNNQTIDNQKVCDPL